MPTVEIFKYKILSIDDNKNNLFTLNALLSTVGNIVPIEAVGAKEALDILLTQHIDLIICDVQMPDINGFELAKLIKSNKKTKDIPIIFVTAVFKSDDFIAQGFELGAVDYLTKPIDDNQLLNKITLYLKIFEQKNQLQQSEKNFYDIAQSIGDGIYTLTIDGKTSFINNEALKLLGFDSKELLNVKIHDYIHYKNSENKPLLFHDCSVYKCMNDGEIYSNENEVLVKKDGLFLHVSMLVTPLYADNNIVGSVVIFKDKTHQNTINVLKEEKIKNQEQMIHSMIDMIESRDSYAAGHSKRVSKYCVLIAKEMKYNKKDIELIKNAAWLHDIGKISTSDSVLLKQSQFDDFEYELIKKHLDSGYEMLYQIDQYKVLSDVMREHHERYDGSGYPRGLKGNEIKPLSQIMIVADAFDAMTTNRVYKEKKSIKVALKELESLSAIQFHPDVVVAAVVALSKVKVD
ncbi:HD domain-containing phosphohydrolase [Sulfurimonas sp.]|uniref:HD domain-containing phosphohydrolase n=1 Tax=Sulfurimonas sp. TaxID=2022749 RepID=UPI002B45AA49|nr:HD domain-containing phosphohydrolase [Sulfurimonas sp.]